MPLKDKLVRNIDEDLLARARAAMPGAPQGLVINQALASWLGDSAALPRLIPATVAPAELLDLLTKPSAAEIPGGAQAALDEVRGDR